MSMFTFWWKESNLFQQGEKGEQGLGRGQGIQIGLRTRIKYFYSMKHSRQGTFMVQSKASWDSRKKLHQGGIHKLRHPRRRVTKTDVWSVFQCVTWMTKKWRKVKKLKNWGDVIFESLQLNSSQTTHNTYLQNPLFEITLFHFKREFLWAEFYLKIAKGWDGLSNFVVIFKRNSEKLP